MILKIRIPGKEARNFAFFGEIKSIEVNYGLYRSWKQSDFDHQFTEDGNKSKDTLCVLVLSATFKDGHSENFIVSSFAYIMSDEGKTIEKLFSM